MLNVSERTIRTVIQNGTPQLVAAAPINRQICRLVLRKLGPPPCSISANYGGMGVVAALINVGAAVRLPPTSNRPVPSLERAVFICSQTTTGNVR